MPRTKTISDDQILEAARTLFLERGFGASTLAIARKASISEALIFRRFRTKEALFAAALGLGDIPPWVHKLEGLAGKGDARRNLVDISREVIDYYDNHLPKVMMIWSSRMRAPVRRQLRQPPALRNLKALTRHFEREIALGRIRKRDPEIVARALLGALLNHAFYKLMGVGTRKQISARRYVTSLIDVLWDGLSPERATGVDR